MIRSPAFRRHAALAGLAVLALGWIALPPFSDYAPFVRHMATHLLVVAVAAPLLALALSGGRFDPTRRGPVVGNPLFASLVEFVAVWGWHAPALHAAARLSPGGAVLEQGSFLAAGLLVWLAAFRPANRGAGIVGLLLTAMHMALLGVLLALAPRSLYAAGLCGGTWPSVTPLVDQQIGGVMMLLVGGTAYVGGALWLLAGLLAERPTPVAGRRG